MPHAASTGQSCTHCSGGGEVVAPCSRRGSSLASARANTCKPSVVSSGATPSRHTLRQLSMIVSPLVLFWSWASCQSRLSSRRLSLRDSLYLQCKYVHL